MATPVLHVIAAAARLACLYGLGVVLLLLALVFWTGDWIGNVRAVLQLHGLVFGSLFAASFILLATARRLGFATLWLLLIGLWLWPVAKGWSGISLLALFVFWSVVALPLYILGAIGFPGRRFLHLRRWTATVPALVVVLWVLLLLLTLAVTPANYLLVASAVTGSFGKPPSLVLGLVPFLWGAAPILIALEALNRLRPEQLPSTGGLTSA
jgi:hypothetical protein